MELVTNVRLLETMNRYITRTGSATALRFSAQTANLARTFYPNFMAIDL